jgi:hypothetical protein
MTVDEHVPLATLIEKEYERMDETDGPETDGLEEKNLRLLDALYHNAGIVASEDPTPLRPDELEDDEALKEFVERLAGG